MTPPAATDGVQGLFDAALKLLSRREHSRFELQQKLSGRFPGADFDALFERLHRFGYQSDQRFAETFARSRVRRGYGPLRIRSELQQRGIGKALIDDVLEQIGADWCALAAGQLRYRFHSPVSAALPREQRLKEVARRQRYLFQRGFPASLIQQVLDARDFE